MVHRRKKEPSKIAGTKATVGDVLKPFLSLIRSAFGFFRSLRLIYVGHFGVLAFYLFLPVRDPHCIQPAVIALSTSASPLVFETRKGEYKPFDLPDGSVVYLDTQTVLWVQITPQMRLLQLKAGRAQFNVRRDPSRPFRVLGGLAVTDVLGTQFVLDVRNLHRTVVVVLEGAVRVARGNLKPEHVPYVISTLFAAQGAEVPDRLGEPPIIRSNLSHEMLLSATGWTQGQLYLFGGSRLSRVADELRRYNDVNFQFANPATERLILGGTIGLKDIPGFQEKLLGLCVSSKLKPSDPAGPTYTLRLDPHHCKP